MMFRSVAALLSSLVLSANLGAAVLTVGPDGAHQSVQAAVDAAIAAGGDQEIRVQTGSYQEHVSVVDPDFAGTILILGGWNDDFTARSTDPGSTVVDGHGDGRPLTLELAGGAVQVDSITLSNGVAEDPTSFGGGVEARLSGDAVLEMDNCTVSRNSAVSPSQAWGGGVSVVTRGSAELHLSRVAVTDNVVDCGLGAGGSGGLYIVASDASVVTISSARIEGNSVRTKNAFGLIQYGGIAVFGEDDAIAAIEDTLVRANSLEGSTYVWASGAQLGGGQSLTVRRCRFIDNVAPLSDGVYQLIVPSGRLTDSIVAGGNANGMYLGPFGATVEAANLTIADVPGTGVSLYPGTGATIALFNSIAFGNAVDVEVLPGSAGLIAMDFNLIGNDPGFVDPASRDYHLLIGSPAENAGTSSPPGGLGPLDCDRRPRIIGSAVDIGAFEGISELFNDGFESATTQAWSNVVPDHVEPPPVEARRNRS